MEFLVMTGKIFLFINFFCYDIFQFLVYFLCKNCNPLKNITSSFPPTPLKIKVLPSPPPSPPPFQPGEVQPSQAERARTRATEIQHNILKVFALKTPNFSKFRGFSFYL